MEVAEDFGGDAVALPKQTEQEMFGANVGMV
jgi:hypothetical protein